VRPIPQALTVLTTTYAALAVVVVVFQGWRRDVRRTWFSRRWRFPQFLIGGVFLIVVWAWILFSTPAPATGDPRWRGGYSPAEQRDLIK